VDIEQQSTTPTASLATDPYRHLDYLAAHQPCRPGADHGVVSGDGHEEVITVLRSPTCFLVRHAHRRPADARGSSSRKLPTVTTVTRVRTRTRESCPQNDQIVTADPPVPQLVSAVRC